MPKDLTHHPIPTLIRGIAIPASIGFVFSTLDHIVDSWFAGMVSTEALAALGLSFPVFFSIIAIGLGIATGSTALLSNALGAKKVKEVELLAAQAISFGLILSVLLTFMGLSLSPHLFRLLGATEEYLALSLSYMNMIFLGTVFFMITFILNSILQAHGNTRTFRNVLILGFGLNFILNPAFMYGWAGLPAFGLKGIALATVLIQFIGTLVMAYKVSQLALFSRKSLGMIVPKKRSFLEITKHGGPASINTMTVALGIFIITYFVKDFGNSAVAAFGIVQRIEQLAMLPVMGLHIATLAIVGQNNGAGKFHRVRQTIWTTLIYGLCLMMIGAAAMFVIPHHLMTFFTRDSSVISVGVAYLRIAAFISWGYIILHLVVSSLQGMKRPMFAVWIGLYRQIIGAFFIFFVVRGVLDLDITAIWWSIFFLVWSSAMVAVYYLKRTLTNVVKEHRE